MWGTLLHPPSSAPLGGCWWGCPAEGGWLSPTGAVPAQELTQKLEKQERTTLKLQKQLRAYAKQIQELTGKCLRGRELWGWLEGHQPGGRLEHHPASTWGAEFHPPTQQRFWGSRIPPKKVLGSICLD